MLIIVKFVSKPIYTVGEPPTVAYTISVKIYTCIV